MPDPTPRDVILAALVVPSPPQEVDPRPDIEWRADLIEKALRDAGVLPPVEVPPPGERELDEVAMWLAEESRHPRYTVAATETQPPGWDRLRCSDVDVNVAYTAAVRGVTAAARIQQLQNARDVLIRGLR